MTTLVLILSGVSAYVLSFINSASYVDYALGGMLAILSIFIIMNFFLCEKNMQFTNSFRRHIASIKIDDPQKIINEINNFIAKSIREGITFDLIKESCLENGYTEDDINTSLNYLIQNGILEQVSPNETKSLKTKKTKKKKNGNTKNKNK